MMDNGHPDDRPKATPAERKLVAYGVLGTHLAVVVGLVAAVAKQSAGLALGSCVALVSWWIGFSVAAVIAQRTPS